MVWDKRALRLLRGHGRDDFYPAAVGTEKSGFSRRPHASATNKGKQTNARKLIDCQQPVEEN
jgi:hypothetical protein